VKLCEFFGCYVITQSRSRQLGGRHGQKMATELSTTLILCYDLP
jgi:hypothetical protein